MIDRPIFMPRLDSAVSVVVDPATTTTLDNTVIDVQLEIPPDTVFDENGDAYTGSLSLSEVPPEFTPGALPDTLDPSMVVTIQPIGLTFE
ncbi:MAG: hypothetical protein OXT09_34095 [Myxococcales bacterium]|nr:hypothetical protein [Myxococcales bacterium]